jgi:hypothetical protein
MTPMPQSVAAYARGAPRRAQVIPVRDSRHGHCRFKNRRPAPGVQ